MAVNSIKAAANAQQSYKALLLWEDPETKRKPTTAEREGWKNGLAMNEIMSKRQKDTEANRQMHLNHAARLRAAIEATT